MRARIRALLVHYEEMPMTELKFVLDRLGIETWGARTCAEAEAALSGAEPPRLIFTDTVLTDGTWANVTALAGKGRLALSVIVVSRQVDIPLYLDVLESGASDFIVPPFRDADVAQVVKGALGGS
jgi:DNA-binding NtrC family response regulator